MIEPIFASVWDSAFGGPIVLQHNTADDAIATAQIYAENGEHAARAARLDPDNSLHILWAAPGKYEVDR